MINKYIETQNFKAHIVSIIIWLARSIMMTKDGLYCGKSFYEESIHILP
jgi:hypothetical protein